MKKLFIYLALIFLSLNILIISCKKDDKTENPGNSEITIGVLLPKTGAAASTGESTEKTLKFALEDIQKYLSDIGSKISVKLIIEDTETDTAVGLQKLISLNEKGVQVVIGPYTSAGLKTVMDYANQNDLLIISPSSVATSLAVPDDNIYRLISSDISQGEAMTALLNDDSIEMLIPIIRDDLWGNELLATISQQFTNSKKAIYTPVKYATSTTDFMSFIYQLKVNLMDAMNQYPSDKIGIYMASFGEGTGILEEATNEASLAQVRWYGSSGYAEYNTLPLNTTAAEFAYLRGLACPNFGLDPDAQDKWQPLINKIEAEIGRKPEMFALITYDALWLTVLSYLSAGIDIKTENLIKAFVQEANIYYGVTGRTSLNEAGDRAYANYDFWGIGFNSAEYSWQIVARYNNASGLLTRY